MFSQRQAAGAPHVILIIGVCTYVGAGRSSSRVRVQNMVQILGELGLESFYYL